jgi:hypothetical protein
MRAEDLRAPVFASSIAARLAWEAPLTWCVGCSTGPQGLDRAQSAKRSFGGLLETIDARAALNLASR